MLPSSKRLSLAVAAVVLLAAAAGCENNPPAMQPGALEAKGKLQQCCDQVDAAFHKATPNSDAAHAWEAASTTCKNELAEFRNDVPSAISAVQKSLGKDDLVAEAPMCKRP